MKKVFLRSIKEELTVLLVCVAAAFIIGLIAEICVVSYGIGSGVSAAEVEVIPAASVISILAAGIVTIFVGGFTLKNRFNLAVGMSSTRKLFIACEVVTTISSMIVAAILVKVIMFVEKLMYTVAFSGVAIEEESIDVVQILTSLPIVLVGIAVVVATRFFIGFILLKFSEKGLFIILVPYWILCMFMARISQSKVGEFLGEFIVNLVNNLVRINRYMPHIVGIAILITTTVVISAGIKKAEVR